MRRKQIARQIAEESIVLLKNEEHVLPLQKGKTVALFGRTQIDTLYSGNGSGRTKADGHRTILEQCGKSGLIPESALKEYYEYKIGCEEITEIDEFDWTKVSEIGNSGLMYEIFGRYRAPLEEYEVPEQLLLQTTKQTDTALFILGRNSGGEECDRHLEDDYYLTKTEKKLVDIVCKHFANVIIILNINGLIDLSWVDHYTGIKGVIFIGIPGEEGAAALARVLTGQVNPSGKMAVTVAKQYKDYPSARYFSWNKAQMDQISDYASYGLSAEENGSIGFAKSPVTIYYEDIYAGYRYFDTFKKEPLYPFGYGLSYTTFEIGCTGIQKTATGILIQITVTNTGGKSGREVVQLYMEKKADEGGMERPYQELKGFAKTDSLEPGGRDRLEIRVPWRELAVYDEKRSSWVIEEGTYILYIGNSSRNTSVVGRIGVEEDILVEVCVGKIGVSACNRGKIKFLTRGKMIKEESCSDLKNDIISVSMKDVKSQTEIPGDNGIGYGETDRLVSDLSDRELAALCVGYGPGIPFAMADDSAEPSTIFDEAGTPLTTNSHSVGYPGYVSPAIEKKGIWSVFYKDGPAGIGGIAWPTEMLITCSFDRKLWRKFGDALGAECENQKVDVWLAPAVNLHRNPLCGRNFEYFSEDPYLTGVCACEIVTGAQGNHRIVACPKHFAINEQETFRRGNAKKHIDATDSIVTERAARELYLKPFEMLVRQAKISCVMTSFNKINGIFAAGNRELCNSILRYEWGFDGFVVSDWGDMDIVVDGADAVAAGNDIIMPGGPPVIRQILKGLEDGRVTRADLESAVRHLLNVILK